MTNAKEYLFANNYIVINDFIPPEQALILYETFKNDCKNNPEVFIKDPQCPKSPAIYDYRWFLELLVEKTPLMAQIIEEPVLPTYCYARLYANGDDLKKHTDREACEYSVTLHLGSDGTDWDISFTKPNGEEVSVNLKPGQAVVYLGCISTHWRDKFEGQEYGQVFLHYVRSRAENWDCYFDKHRKNVIVA